MLKEHKPITSAALVKEKVEEEDDVQVTTLTVTKVLREELRLGYRRTRKVPI